VNRPRKLDYRSRKSIRPWVCGGQGRGLLFPDATGETLRLPDSGYGAAKAEPGRTPTGRVPRGSGNRSSGWPGDRTGISRDRRAACRPADFRIRSSLETGRAVTGSLRSSDRGFSVSARRRLRPSTTSERSWVPGPTPIGTRAPRGLRLRPMLPRGLLVSGGDKPADRGPWSTRDQ
jgi:hypothetical protein